MQQKPSGWPTSEGVETIPQVQLVLENGTWPPSDGVLPSGTAEVGDWSLNRTLTGGGLPGGVRGTSGFSVAEGEASLPQPDSGQVSPWGIPGRRATVNGSCQLVAAHPGIASDVLPLGTFLVDQVAGSSTAAELSVSVLEAQTQMGRFNYAWQFDAIQRQFDAADVLNRVLADSGLRAHPPASWTSRIGSQVLDATLQGRVRTDSGTSSMSATTVTASWGSVSGVGGQTNAGLAWFEASMRSRQGNAFSVLVTIADGGSRIVWGDVAFDIRSDRAVLEILGTVHATVQYSAAGDPTKTLLASWNAATKTFTIIDLQATTGVNKRLGTYDPAVLASMVVSSAPASGVYSSTVSDIVPLAISTPSLGDAPKRMILGVTAFIEPVVITDGKWVGHRLTEPWEPQTVIEMTDSPLNGVFDANGASAWEVLQDIAKATMGAMWRDERGRIVYRNRRSLRDSTPVETVLALESLESVDWVISSENTADRVELNYTPTQVTEDVRGGITIWEATEPVQIHVGETRVLSVDFNGSTDRLMPFIPVWDESLGPIPVKGSRWAASYNRFGGSTRPPDDALIVSAEVIGPSKAKISITNTTSSPLWTVDANGNTQLTLRTSVHVEPGEQESVSDGLPESLATTPFSFDAGAWVQSPIVAQEMLAWLRSQTASPNAVVSDVRVVPDLSRQLGDTVIIRDELTALTSKAIITGVGLNGSHDGYEQRLTFALLERSFSDLDKWVTANSVATFADLDAALNALGITTFQGLEEWLSANLLGS